MSETLVAILGFTAFGAHATVSYRSQPWLPLWLGRGCTAESPSVHLRVSFCNYYYGGLMLWLAYASKLNPNVPLKAMFTLAAVATIIYGSVRLRQFLKTIRK